MALNPVQFKADLKADLLTIFNDLDPTRTTDEKADQLADVLSARIDAYIRTATVSTSVIVQQVTAVQPGAGISGPGSGIGSGTLS